MMMIIINYYQDQERVEDPRLQFHNLLVWKQQMQHGVHRVLKGYHPHIEPKNVQ